VEESLMARKPISYAQRLAIAKAEAAPWWGMLERMYALHEQYTSEGATVVDFPLEVMVADRVARDRIARIYLKHGI
jgi:hypothetical protein